MGVRAPRQRGLHGMVLTHFITFHSFYNYNIILHKDSYKVLVDKLYSKVRERSFIVQNNL